MISVKLFELLSLKDSVRFVPEDIAQLCGAIEHRLLAEPDDRGGFVALADKFDEIHESELVAAAKYIAKRPELMIYRRQDSYRQGEWSFAVKYGHKPEGIDATSGPKVFLNGTLDSHMSDAYETKSIIGLIAKLASGQVKMLEDLT